MEKKLLSVVLVRTNVHTWYQGIDGIDSREGNCMSLLPLVLLIQVHVVLLPNHFNKSVKSYKRKLIMYASRIIYLILIHVLRGV